MISQANGYICIIGILESFIFAFYLFFSYFQLKREDKEEDEFKDL